MLESDATCWLRVLLLVDRTEPGELLVQAFMMARGLDYVAAMMQWNLNFQQVVPQTIEQWGFDIIRSDMSAGPAYSVLLQMPKP
jgi:hypothetical protein